MSPQIAKIIAGSRRLGPYLAIELILPGGSLLALTLWLLRNRSVLGQSLARIHSGAWAAFRSAATLRPSAASTL